MPFVVLQLLGEIEGEVLFCKSATSKERKASYLVTLLEFQAKILPSEESSIDSFDYLSNKLSINC